MISKTQFMNSLIGKPVVDALIQTLYNQMEDFPAIYQAYLDAIGKLHAELGLEAKNEIKKLLPLSRCVPPISITPAHKV